MSSDFSACGQEERPSLRHLVTECPIFDAKRKAVSEEWRLDSDFLQRMPRITSKSGWITFSSHRDAERRSQYQVAVCQVGMEDARVVSLASTQEEQHKRASLKDR